MSQSISVRYSIVSYSIIFHLILSYLISNYIVFEFYVCASVYEKSGHFDVPVVSGIDQGRAASLDGKNDWMG